MAILRRRALSGAVLFAALALAPAFAPFAAPSGHAIANAPEFPECSPGDLDVLFLFDTTGSMTSILSTAKAKASDVMAAISASVPSAWFGVANYRDYPGAFIYPGYTSTYASFGDYPWRLDQPISGSQAAAQAAINALNIGNGADRPEAVSRALTEAQGAGVGWRPGSARVIVLIGDAPPHDDDFTGRNFGLDPGPNAVVGGGDDIEFEDVVTSLVASRTQVVAISAARDTLPDAYFSHLATETGGAFARIAANFVPQVAGLVLGVLGTPNGRAEAVALRGEASDPANPYVDAVPVAAHGASASASQSLTMANIALPSILSGFVTLASDASAYTRATGQVTASASARVAAFSLFGGLLKGEALESRAGSDKTAGVAPTPDSFSRIARLELAGVPIVVDPGWNQIVPLPGIGAAILNERVVTFDADRGVRVLVNAIHLVVERPEVRADLVLASSYAAAGCGGIVPRPPTVGDSDGGSSSDAGGTPAGAILLSSPAVVQGRLLGSDASDYFAVPVAVGEKVVAVLLESLRAEAHAGPLPATPSTATATPEMSLHLRAPGDPAVRDVSASVFPVAERVELNVDVAGDWTIEVRRGATGGNYTLVVATVPIALLPVDSAAMADVGSGCAAAALVDDGVHAGSLAVGDASDWYEVRPGSSARLAAALSMPDLEGQDFNLYAYGAGCALLASSNLGTEPRPKGTAEAVVVAPSPAGVFFIEVRRENGIGNYALSIATG